MSDMTNSAPEYFLGLDAGSISVKLALLDRRGRLMDESYVRHQGRPYQAALESLTAMFKKFDPLSVSPPAVTGVAAGRLAELLGGVHVGEIRALTLAAKRHRPDAGALIDIGGEDTKLLWFQRDPDGGLSLADFAMNALCAAGTGSFLDQQAHRLNYDIGSFAELALKSEVPPRVAGRCSVFAKSDMIHLQQSATPDYEIIYGLCLAMARNLKSSLAKGRALPAPVLFTGGVAANSGLARALGEILELDETSLVIPPHHFVFGAAGAAEALLERRLDKRPVPAGSLFPSDLTMDKGEESAPIPVNSLDSSADSSADHSVDHAVDHAVVDNAAAQNSSSFSSSSSAAVRLAALAEFVGSPHQDPKRLPPLVRPERTPGTAEFDWSAVSPESPLEVYIGVDVGSVSTNVALVTPEGRLVARQYLPTSGRPLEAIRLAFEAIRPEAEGRAKVLGVCCTGSGRYLTADYLGAEMTVNEITAQATAAVAIDPKVDTIFEIGGQDSKYISLKDGVIIDFMMNKACAAGTGSFLEEQADKLGLQIKGEFGELALASTGPVALGERCTVFMESDLVHHQQNGVNVKDLTAGLCYGIVANYLGRVVETRAVGRNIFFQGGTSFNQGVAAAFNNRLGRKVTVPDNADVTGAVGAAMIARDRRTWEESGFVGFDLSNRRYEIESFECRHCPNRCEIRKVSVEGGRPFYYGSRCDRYEEDARRKKSAEGMPDLFAFRDDACFNPPELKLALAARNINTNNNTTTTTNHSRSNGNGNGGGNGAGGGRKSRGQIGLIRSMFFAELGPFWSVFWASLGYEPVWSSPTNKSIIHKGCERTESDFCFPVKAAHGHVQDLLDRGVDHVFLPSMINLPASDVPGAPDNAACPYAQTLAYTAATALGLKAPRLLTGPVYFAEGRKPLEDCLCALSARLGLEASETRAALDAALRAQKAFQTRLRDKGQEVLGSLGLDKMIMIVVARPYNGFDPGLNLRLNQKMRDLGVLGMPMDFLPLDVRHDEPLAHYWRYGQKITAVATAVAADERLEALYISNFGCGPDSFILHFFKHVMDSKPFLEIEIDEHSSDVGAVTRLEAFLDSLAARKARDGRKTWAFPPMFPSPIKVIRGPKPGQTVYIPPMCDHTRTMAAAFRAAGVDAVALPESDRLTIDLGRSQTSGKECYPLILCVGDFMKLTRTPGFDPEKSVLFMPSSNGPCRFGQYGRYISLIMRRLGFPNLEVLSIDQTGGMYQALDEAGATKNGARLSQAIWRALVGVDMLQKALLHARPRELTAGAADRAYEESLAEMVRLIENDDFKGLARAQKNARERFDALRSPDLNSKPRVGLVGEIYVRHNRFANEDVVRRLEALGAEVEAPPLSEWVFYTGFVNTMRAGRQGLWRPRLSAWLTGLAQRREVSRMARAWRGFFPGGATDPPVAEVVGLGEKFLNRSFQGEAILSLGKGLEFYERGARGLVNIMPFTCMPGMVVGALTGSLRREAEGMPAINLAYDGQSQTNTQARLEAFMYQVHNFDNPRGLGRGH